MSGLLGKKIGMTSIFDQDGKNIPCTVLQAGPCVVTQVRTKEIDGYENTLVAPLLLLPFIENCFKHGISKQLNRKKQWLKIGLSVKQDKLVFNLENSIHTESSTNKLEKPQLTRHTF